jgi:hypothetical protein
MSLPTSLRHIAAAAAVLIFAALLPVACRRGGTGAADSTRSFLPVVADTVAGSGRVWKTSLVVEAGGTGETTDISVLYTDQEGTAHRGRILLAPGGGKRIDDLFELFRQSLQPPLAGGNQLGTVELSVSKGTLPPSRVEIHATDMTTGGRIGQSYSSAAIVAASGTLVIPGASTRPEFRTNVGVANPGGHEVEVEIRLHDLENGVAVGDPTKIKVGPRRLVTVNDIVRLLHAPAESKAVAVKLRAIGGKGEVVAYGSIVDSRTDGAIFVAASPER